MNEVMRQLEIQFFWPLTEQIPLELDYANCEKPKYTMSGTTGIIIGTDLIPVDTENLEQVFDFLAGHNSTEHEEEHEIDNVEEFGIEDDEDDSQPIHIKKYSDKKATIVDILCNKTFEREGKIFELRPSKP
jgi:hypothetical protein